MLHIHNGDCSANLLKESDIPGEHLVWREALIAGPTPQDLSHEEWHTVRAKFLANAYGLDVEACRNDLLKQEEALRAFTDHEEVVLWFEHDLFCQTILIYLLDWFSRAKLGSTKLSLVCIDRFPGINNFKGLGQLDPSQMASLFEERHEVTDVEMNVAIEGWQAYRSPDPKAIEDFLKRDTSSLPFLKTALVAHLARFPSLRNGLGRIENKALELISSDFKSFAQLFNAFGEAEPAYGVGDLQFWHDLKRMMEAPIPLLNMSGIDGMDNALKSGNSTHVSFEITEKGKTILVGQENFVAANQIDLWLGGVHLHDKADLWQWDEQHQKLVLARVS